MTGARRRRAAARAAALLGVLAAALAALLAAGLAAASPASATTYRYWTYWWGQPGASSWTFASLGPGSDRPKDQSVVGWRFATTTESGGRRAPRTSASWSDHCSTAAVEGKNRVAVVVDYGTTGDAPPGETPPGGGTVRVECVLVDARANGYAALAAAGVSVRTRGDGLVCGLDGYPRTECAAAVADPTPTPTTTSPKPRPSTASARPTTTSSAAAAPSRTTSAGPGSGSPAAPPPAPSISPDAAEPTSTGPTPTDGDEAPLPVSSGQPVAAAAGTDGGPSSGSLLGVLAVAVLGGAAWWTARRRSL